MAVPGPHRVPAPSPTAAIPSSRSGSACAAGINQRGATQCLAMRSTAAMETPADAEGFN